MTTLQKESANLIAEKYSTTMLNKKQAAKELNISPTQIDRLRKTGELKYRVVGAQIRIPAFAIAEIIS